MLGACGTVSKEHLCIGRGRAKQSFSHDQSKELGPVTQEKKRRDRKRGFMIQRRGGLDEKESFLHDTVSWPPEKEDQIEKF